jgi:hypothetical protein
MIKYVNQTEKHLSVLTLKTGYSTNIGYLIKTGVCWINMDTYEWIFRGRIQISKEIEEHHTVTFSGSFICLKMSAKNGKKSKKGGKCLNWAPQNVDGPP